MQKVFVYGTLLRSLENSALLTTSKYLYAARTVPTFYLVANENTHDSALYEPSDIEFQEKYRYPFVMTSQVLPKQTAHHIIGEVYEVSDQVIKRLDELEGHPTIYKRELVPIVPLCGDSDGRVVEVVHDVEMYILVSEEVIADVTKFITRDSRYKVVDGGSWMEYITTNARL